jgi:2',3'-cyclic-nucleotide 2'-phosphodiesterase (5'-nucleotidase family)
MIGLLLGAAAFGGGCSGSDETEPGTGPGDPPPPKSVTILFTSDEHSHVLAFSPELDDDEHATKPGSGALVGGVSRRAAIIQKERDAAKAAGMGSVLVSAGDNQMGTLVHVGFESGSIDYGAMAALGYDVTTLGNHELDFGPRALASAITGAEAGAGLPPIVATNIKFSDASEDDDELAKLWSADPASEAPMHAYRVVTTDDGVKIGFIGFLGANAEHVAPNKTPVQFSAKGVDPKDEGDITKVLPNLVADLQPVVDTLRNDEKVDLVVALSHAGENDTSSEEAIAKGEDYQIAANVKGIDLIVSGHAHNHDPKPIVVKNAKGGNDTLVLNAGSFGMEVGRVVFTLGKDGGAPSWDPATQALLPVDDTTLPDATLAKTVEGAIASVEKAPENGADEPYLATLLSRSLGKQVTDDPNKVGDLYFYPVGKTDFDVTDVHSMMFLSADAMLASQDALGTPADMALESAGVIRGVLNEGKTGVISAADAFSIVPLGSSPDDGTIGYPLVHANINLLELRAIFEFSLALGPTSSDYDLGQAGVRVEYDATRPLVATKFDVVNPAKGQVMRILLDTDHADGFEQYDKVIYDREQMIGGNADLYSVVSSSYIAQFASDVGAVLKDDAGKPKTLLDAIVKRGDGTEVKQLEAFFGYLGAHAPLPATYQAGSPQATKRFSCIKGC